MAIRGHKIDVVLAQFDDVGGLMSAARKVRDAGYKKFDCHSPFPIHGMNRAMGIKRSGLGYIVAIFALLGMAGGYLLQYYTNAVDYPLVIAGKPFNSFQSDLPVTFAVAILFSAIAALIGMLALNKLPRYNHPLFSSERFRQLADDSFFISIESTDPKFDIERTRLFLESIGGKNAEVLSEE